jgi:error-prone DNA polymerase
VLSPSPARRYAAADGSGSGGGGNTTHSESESQLAVRIGLGYVGGVRVEDVREIVGERERGGAFGSVAELVGRCPGAGETLELLAWAGACDALVEGGRREALWQLGVVAPGPAAATGAGRQLVLPLEPEPAPELPALTAWERMVADYGSTKVTLREHPLELMRPRLPPDVLTSAELEQARTGRAVRVAGLVVARQRPATAKGMTFMLLEDEYGTINLIVSPPVHDRDRLAVRAEPLVLAAGTLERREGTTNVVVDSVERLERPDLPTAEVRHIEPRRVWSTEERDEDLRAVAPAAHSFGRRGR